LASSEGDLLPVTLHYNIHVMWQMEAGSARNTFASLTSHDLPQKTIHVMWQLEAGSARKHSLA